MNLENLWKTVKEDLRVELSEGTFASFIAPTKLEEAVEDNDRIIAVVSALSPFHQRWIEERYCGQIKQSLERVTGKSCELKFTSTPTKIKAIDREAFGPLFSVSVDDGPTYHRAAAAAHLRPDFTFEQFAVSSTNEMAYAAAQAVSRNPGQAYHLLFLFGGVGVGKTHLMQGIGHRILEKDPATKVIYRTAEEFTNEIIEAIRDRTTADFRRKYRSVKALLIDDIQFIGGKEKVQEEFFHTFNTIHQAGGQIVLTSDQFPSDIAGVEDRLKSRFEGGLIIDIQQPSFELRAAIVLIKAKAWGLEIPMDAAQMIAANIESTRFLEGVLKRLLAEAQTHSQIISTELAEKVLKSFRANSAANSHDSANSHRVTSQAVIEAICQVFGVKPTQLKGNRRLKELVSPRHLAMYVLRTEAGMPLTEIGKVFGGRDHTTVLYATDKITAGLVDDARLRGTLAEVRKMILI